MSKFHVMWKKLNKYLYIKQYSTQKRRKPFKYFIEFHIKILTFEALEAHLTSARSRMKRRRVLLEKLKISTLRSMSVLRGNNSNKKIYDYILIWWKLWTLLNWTFHLYLVFTKLYAVIKALKQVIQCVLF